MICYYFDISRTCSGQAAGDLLSQAPIENIATWAPTFTECVHLLSGQQLYLEAVGNRVFSAALASANSAVLYGFELLAQSWVLRVGHYQLINMHPAFVAAINSISDWTTVHCDGTDILYDGATMKRPDFFVDIDCFYLSQRYVSTGCSNSGCSLPDAESCCLTNTLFTCCQDHYTELLTACSQVGCSLYSICCAKAKGSQCCP
jgi:hypothetical protein